MVAKNDEEFDSRGVPNKSGYDKMPLPVPILYTVFNGIFSAIGFAIAIGVYTQGSTGKYDAKMGLLKEFDLGWLYLTMTSVKIGMLLIGINLGSARKASKINVPDQQCYIQRGKNASKNYIFMENEGVIGRFNRAQRALQNTLENLTLLCVDFCLSAFVFPFPAFVVATLWVLARAHAARNYTAHTDGRTGGNMFSQILKNVLDGFVLLSALKALGWV